MKLIKLQLLERELELQDAADAADARAKKAEAALAQLKATLEERDKSLALISRMAKEKENYLYYANVKIIQLVEKLEKANIPETPILSLPASDTTAPAPAVAQQPAKEEEPAPKQQVEPAPTPEIQAAKPEAHTTEDHQPSVDRRDSAQNANRRINKRRSAVISHTDFVSHFPPLPPSFSIIY